MEKIKIAVVSAFNPVDIAQRSGAIFFVCKLFRSLGFELKFFQFREINFFLRIFFAFKKKFYKRVKRKRFDIFLEPLYLRTSLFEINKKLARNDHDLVFCTIPFIAAFLKSDRPIFFWHDASFAGSVDFIPSGRNLSLNQIKKGHRIEQAALDNTAMIIYSNHYAGLKANENYKVNPDKIHIIPYGANLELASDRSFDDIKEIVNRRAKDKMNLLFVAGEWYNKRGDFALEVAKYINANKMPVVLNIVGIMPEKENLPEYIKYHGFVDKNTTAGLDKIKRFYSRAHFLILPSLSECAPHQYCEASAFGVPSLGSNVGGTSTILKDEINGKLFDLDSTPEEYGDYMIQLFNNNDEYKELCYSSFAEYLANLNWCSSGEKVAKVLESKFK